MSNNKIGENLGLKFTLLTTFFASWIFLYKYVISLTTESPSHSMLGFYALIHYIIFIYLIISFLVFGLSTVSLVDGETVFSKKYYNKLSRNLFKSWVVFVPYLFISVLNYFVQGERVKNVIAILFLVSLFLYFTFKKNGIMKGYKKVRNEFFKYVLFVIGFMLYVLFLSYFTSGVKIETNKEFYLSSDMVLISMRSSGYIFLPNIDSVKYNGLTIEEYDCCQNKEYIKLDLQKHFEENEYSNLLYIDVTPQVISIKKTIYEYIKVFDNEKSL